MVSIDPIGSDAWGLHGNILLNMGMKKALRFRRSALVRFDLESQAQSNLHLSGGKDARAAAKGAEAGILGTVRQHA